MIPILHLQKVSVAMFPHTLSQGTIAPAGAENSPKQKASCRLLLHVCLKTQGYTTRAERWMRRRGESFLNNPQEIYVPGHRRNKQDYDYVNESFPLNSI